MLWFAIRIIILLFFSVNDQSPQCLRHVLHVARAVDDQLDEQVEWSHFQRSWHIYIQAGSGTKLSDGIYDLGEHVGGDNQLVRNVPDTRCSGPTPEYEIRWSISIYIPFFDLNMLFMGRRTVLNRWLSSGRRIMVRLLPFTIIIFLCRFSFLQWNLPMSVWVIWSPPCHLELTT